jgi:hypothetical protein
LIEGDSKITEEDRMSAQAAAITPKDYDTHFQSKADTALSQARRSGRSWGVVDRGGEGEQLKRVADAVTREVQLLLAGTPNLRNRGSFEEAFRYASAIKEGKEVRVFDSESTSFFFRWTHSFMNKFSDKIRYIDKRALDSAHAVLKRRFEPQQGKEGATGLLGVLSKARDLGAAAVEKGKRVAGAASGMAMAAIAKTGQVASAAKGWTVEQFRQARELEEKMAKTLQPARAALAGLCVATGSKNEEFILKWVGRDNLAKMLFGPISIGNTIEVTIGSGDKAKVIVITTDDEGSHLQTEDGKSFMNASDMLDYLKTQGATLSPDQAMEVARRREVAARPMRQTLDGKFKFSHDRRDYVEKKLGECGYLDNSQVACWPILVGEERHLLMRINGKTEDFVFDFSSEDNKVLLVRVGDNKSFAIDHQQSLENIVKDLLRKAEPENREVADADILTPKEVLEQVETQKKEAEQERWVQSTAKELRSLHSGYRMVTAQYFFSENEANLEELQSLANRSGNKVGIITYNQYVGAYSVAIATPGQQKPTETSLELDPTTKKLVFGETVVAPSKKASGATAAAVAGPQVQTFASASDLEKTILSDVIPMGMARKVILKKEEERAAAALSQTPPQGPAKERLLVVPVVSSGPQPQSVEPRPVKPVTKPVSAELPRVELESLAIGNIGGKQNYGRRLYVAVSKESDSPPSLETRNFASVSVIGKRNLRYRAWLNMLAGVLPASTTIDDVIEATKRLPQNEKALLKKLANEKDMFLREGGQETALQSLAQIG